MKKIMTIAASALLSGTIGAHAATVTVFDDDFTADSDGVGGYITTTTLTNWNVTQGNIDVLGAIFGCNGCLDLDGSNSPATAVLETKTIFDFSVGEYKLAFYFAGGTEQETITLTVGSSQAFLVAGNGPSVIDVTLFANSAFSSTIQLALSGPLNNFGPYLDRVLITYETAAVPLPAAAPLLLAALGGLGVAARRRRAAA